RVVDLVTVCKRARLVGHNRSGREDSWAAIQRGGDGRGVNERFKYGASGTLCYCVVQLAECVVTSPYKSQNFSCVRIHGNQRDLRLRPLQNLGFVLTLPDFHALR